MSILFVTGCNSFIGEKLCQRLLSEGHEVHGLVTHESHAKVEGVKTHRSDLMNFTGIQNILEEGKPEFIVHLAARTEVEKSFYEPVDFSLINFGGSVNLIEKAKHLDNLKLFIFASTMETYGEVHTKEEVLDPKVKKLPFDENTPQRPNAPYSVAKIGVEYYLRYAKRAYNFPFTAFRQTNSYGRHDNDFFVVEQIITQMLKNPDEVRFGYKHPWRNFLYIDDLIDLYTKAMSHPEKVNGEFFCTGPANAIRIEDLATKIAEMLGYEGKILWDTKPERVGEIYYLNSTTEKAYRVLGWKPKTSLDEGLKKTINQWKSKLSQKKSSAYTSSPHRGLEKTFE